MRNQSSWHACGGDSYMDGIPLSGRVRPQRCPDRAAGQSWM